MGRNPSTFTRSKTPCITTPPSICARPSQPARGAAVPRAAHAPASSKLLLFSAGAFARQAKHKNSQEAAEAAPRYTRTKNSPRDSGDGPVLQITSTISSHIDNVTMSIIATISSHINNIKSHQQYYTAFCCSVNARARHLHFPCIRTDEWILAMAAWEGICNEFRNGGGRHPLLDRRGFEEASLELLQHGTRQRFATNERIMTDGDTPSGFCQKKNYAAEHDRSLDWIQDTAIRPCSRSPHFHRNPTN